MTTTELDSDIARWRGYLERRTTIAPDDVAEMEDHLREQIGELSEGGLSESEAFLVAITRLGSVDEISREFAREHTERMWKQLALTPAASPEEGGRRRGELGVVLALAVGSAAAVKAGFLLLGETRLALTMGLLIAPFLGAYFAWKRRVGLRPIVICAAILVVAAVILSAYPFPNPTDTAVLSVIHAPIVLWLVIGVMYVGGAWRSARRRMDFIRFTGEFIVYYALLALGGGVLVGLTVGSFNAVGIDLENVIVDWVLPIAMPGAALIAAWLVEAKQNVVENIAPVLTRVFTPLTILMLLALLGAYVTVHGGPADSERTLLIVMDLILVLVLGLVLYAISARSPAAPAGLIDWLQLVLVVAALVVDVLMLVAMLTRIAEFGTSPNKIAALGVNLVLLVNLAGSAWLSLAFLRGRRTPQALESWQTNYLPVYGIWAAAVVIALPPIFGFA